MARKKKTTKPAPEAEVRKGISTLERYGLWMLILLFLFALLVVSLTSREAIVVSWVATLANGLIGKGYYVLPVALLAAVFRLLVPKKRGSKPELWLQMTAIFVSCFAIGMVAHGFAARAGDMALAVPGQFFAGAKEGTAAGILSGWLFEAMERCFSLVITRIISIIFCIVCLLYACGITVGRAVGYCIIGYRRLAASAGEHAEASRLRREEEKAVAEKERREQERRAKEQPTEEAVPVGVQTKLSDYGKDYAPARIDVPLSDKKTEPPLPRTPVKGEPVREEPVAEPSVETETEQEPSAAEPDYPRENPAPWDEAEQTETEPDRMTRKEVAREVASISKEIHAAQAAPAPEYVYPPIDLVGTEHTVLSQNSDTETKAGALKLVETLKSFGVEGRIINVTHGPTVTRYELQLNSGTRLSKVQNLSNDIAIAMCASVVRIVLIPDRSAVGIEVPNRTTTSVLLRDVLESPDFINSKSKVTVGLGMDITGKSITWDIAKLPHLLVAGTTGSGKSVCINSLLISLLYKATPEEVRLIMVDPKMVELGVYNSIPHLLIPVVTDPKKAAGALQWAVLEMMSRYKKFSEAEVRSLAEYNDYVMKKNAEAEAEAEGKTDEDGLPVVPLKMDKIPETVIVIDELADLMLVAKKDVEDAICRIAQMGRASGMHLIVATQRPSADVITGLMKANIPSRIAFAVASQLESRIILDNTGAEKLVGKGDMLFNPIGAQKPIRIQGCFVSSGQVEAVTDFVRAHAADGNHYDEDVIRQIEQKSQDRPEEEDSSDMGGGGGDEDDLLMEAIELIVTSRQASTSMLQRKLGVGHSRAGRLMDQMEERGIVGPFAGSKTRDVLISKEEWQEIRMRNDNIDDSL